MATTAVLSPSAHCAAASAAGCDDDWPLGLMCCSGVDGAFEVSPVASTTSPLSSSWWGTSDPAQTEPSSGESSEAQWPATATELLPPGLLNLGNTCYLNSAVQMLASLEHFVGDVAESCSAAPCGGVCSCWGDDDGDADAATAGWAGRGGEEFESSILEQDCVADVVASSTSLVRGAREDGAAATLTATVVDRASGRSDGSTKSSSSQESSKDKPLRDAFAHVVSALRSPPPPPPSSLSGRGAAVAATQAVNPRALKSAVGAAAPLFAGYAQQDSHEFLSALLDLLHDEMRAPEAKLEAVEEEEEEAEGEEMEEVSGNTERALAESVRDSAAGSDSAREARTVTELARLIGVGAVGAREVRTATELARLVGGRAHATSGAQNHAPALRRTGDDRDGRGGGSAHARSGGAAAAETATATTDNRSDVPSETGGGVIPIHCQASSMRRSESCDACGHHRRRRRSVAAAVAGTTPVEAHFATEVRLRLTCNSCGTSRDRIETHRHLSLEVGGSGTTVGDGLRNYFASETVEVKCENEKCDGRSATQTARIVQLPRAILLHFKRFIMDISPDYSRTTYRKDHSPVQFPQVLKIVSDGEELEEDEDGSSDVASLAEFLAPDTDIPPPLFPILGNGDLQKKGGGKGNGRRRQTYHLRSVVHHIGQSVNRGHYSADAYRSSGGGSGVPSSSGGAWMRFDDAAVSRVEVKDVTGESARKTAYMVLYELD